MEAEARAKARVGAAVNAWAPAGAVVAGAKPNSSTAPRCRDRRLHEGPPAPGVRAGGSAGLDCLARTHSIRVCHAQPSHRQAQTCTVRPCVAEDSATANGKGHPRAPAHIYLEDFARAKV